MLPQSTDSSDCWVFDSETNGLPPLVNAGQSDEGVAQLRGRQRAVDHQREQRSLVGGVSDLRGGDCVGWGWGWGWDECAVRDGARTCVRVGAGVGCVCRVCRYVD